MFAIDVLKEVLNENKGKVVFFLGAGFSSIAGCDTGDEMKINIIKSEIIDPRKAIDIQDASSHTLEEVANHYLGNTKDKGKFWQIIEKSTFKNPDKYNTRYYPLIRSITNIKPLPIILTTNIDSCLQETRLFSNYFCNIKDFSKKNVTNGNIFHLHGYITDIKNVVLATPEYSKRYESRKYKDFLKYIFSNYNVIFIGFNIEIDIARIMFLSKEKSNKKEHYAIFHETSNNIKKEKYYKESLNINIIQYNGSLNELDLVLKKWIDKYYPSISFKQNLGGEIQ